MRSAGYSRNSPTAMNILKAIVASAALLTCAYAYPPISEETFFKDFLEKKENNMKSFFEEQKSRVQKVLENGYEEATKMKNSVNTYVEQQQKKINSDINSYVDSVKENGRKVVDSFSFVPPDDAESRLDNPDLVLTVPAIIAKNGYPVETHIVESQGYLLNIHRIPHSKTSREISRNAVLLQHGLFASSADWILNGPEKGLAYVLADAGYDVWMTNVRGNRYSREHAFLKPDSKAYWNFSWHDVAEHDLPSIIDYIAEHKGKSSRITYIGHSMGTTMLFAMLSLRPEYNEKLTAGFALAPIAFMSDIKSPLKAVAPITSNVAYMEMLYGSHEFIPKKSALGRIASTCTVDGMDFVVCKNIIFYIVGQNEKQLNKTLLPVFLSHLGTGTSWKTAVHFAQEVVAGGKFQQFDYGPYHNEKKYGSLSPPEYDLSKVTLPIKLFWAKNDLLSSEQDILMLYKKLNPESTELYLVPDPEFNHLDYLWALEAPRLINDKVLKFLDEVLKNDVVFSFNFGLGK